MTAQYPIVPGITFKDISGFPAYCVGDDGSVWSKHRSARWNPSGAWRRMTAYVARSGHLVVRLCGPGTCQTLLVHRLVLEAFSGPCPPGMECCHNDGVPSNNLPRNLRWDTKAANAADAMKHGQHVPPPHFRGEQHHAAKLATQDIHEIRRLISEGLNCPAIAKRFGVTRYAISDIKNGRSWSHV